MNEKIIINIYNAKVLINAIIEAIIKLGNDKTTIEKLTKINEKISFIEEIAASNEEKVSGDLEKLFKELRGTIDNLLIEMHDIPIATQILLELRDEVYKIYHEYVMRKNTFFENLQ